MNNTVYVTPDLIGENLDEYINRCVKRDCPIPVTIDELFYNDDDGFHDNGFSPTELVNYITNLNRKGQKDFESLVNCINKNIEIKSRVVEIQDSQIILVTIVNEFESSILELTFPFWDRLNSYITDHEYLVTSCQVTFADIKEYLGL